MISSTTQQPFDIDDDIFDNTEQPLDVDNRSVNYDERSDLSSAFGILS
jgi:hypothetical protein